MDHKGLSFTHVPHIKEILNLRQIGFCICFFFIYYLNTHAEITMVIEAYMYTIKFYSANFTSLFLLHFRNIIDQCKDKDRVIIGKKEKGDGLPSRKMGG